MTVEEVIENELKCVQRDCCRLENECAKCDLVLPKEEIINAYNNALRLEKENAELKDKLKNLESVAEVRLANWQKYEKENAELKEQNIKFQKILTEDFIKDVSVSMEYADKLEQAKEIIRDLLGCLYSVEYDRVTDLEEAEQFLKEDK